MYSRRLSNRNAKLMPRRYESHTGSFWQVAKAIAQTLIKKGSHFEVYYPTQSTLQKVADAESENDMDNAFAQTMKGHYRFVFSRNDTNDDMKLYPTVIVLSDDMYSSDKDMAAFMAGHVYVQEELLLDVVERFFEDDSEATLADIFDAVDVRRERLPKKTNRKGKSYVDQDDSGVDVHGFALADNGTVRDLCMDAMVAALDDDLNADFDDVCAKLTVQNPGIVPFNAGMTDNAMSNKLPKYRMENGSVIQVSNNMDFKEIKSLVSKYMMEWCEPRNHSGKMWNKAWEYVLENILLDHWDDNVDVLDFNPYYVERRNIRSGYIHLTKEMLSRIRPAIRRNKKESRRFNSIRRNRRYEAYNVDMNIEDIREQLPQMVVDAFSSSCKDAGVSSPYRVFSMTFKWQNDSTAILTLKRIRKVCLKFVMDMYDEILVTYADTGQTLCALDVSDYDSADELAMSIALSIRDCL